MSKTPDQKFVDMFMGVLAALVLFTVAVAVLANVISGRTIEVSQRNNSAARSAMLDRIAPIGSALVAGEKTPNTQHAAPAPVVVPEPVVVTARSGDVVYNLACVACHAMGIAGAPKLGEVELWAPRIAQGTETLLDHAINGYTGDTGFMPARGGNMSLSDEDIAAAVEYMVSQSQ